jgi:hypothetical protein
MTKHAEHFFIYLLPICTVRLFALLCLFF